MRMLLLLLRDEVGACSSRAISRGRSRIMLWLWSMLTLLWMVWEDAVGDGRRGRRCLMSDMLECGLVLELRRHHLRFD